MIKKTGNNKNRKKVFEIRKRKTDDGRRMMGNRKTKDDRGEKLTHFIVANKHQICACSVDECGYNAKVLNELE